MRCLIARRAPAGGALAAFVPHEVNGLRDVTALEPRAAGLRALDTGGGGGGVVAAGCALGVATICFCLCCCGVGGVVDSGCSLCGALVVFSVG